MGRVSQGTAGIPPGSTRASLEAGACGSLQGAEGWGLRLELSFTVKLYHNLSRHPRQVTCLLILGFSSVNGFIYT